MKKTIRSIISVLLILSVIFTCLALPAGAAEPNKTEEPNTYGSYYEKIYNEGYTPLSTEKALATLGKVNDAFECILGIRIINDEKIKTTVTGCISDMFDEIKETSNGIIDCRLITDSLPQTNGLAKKITKLFSLDPAKVSKTFKDKADEYYKQGNSAMGSIFLFFGAYMHIYEEFTLYSEPNKKNPNIQDVLFKITYEDGTSEIFHPGIKYNTETGILYSSGGKGIMGVGFDYDANNQTLYALSLIHI